MSKNQPMKPIVMAVEGYALAGGTEILQGTDIRVAAEDAIFGVTECKRGLFPLEVASVAQGAAALMTSIATPGSAARRRSRRLR